MGFIKKTASIVSSLIIILAIGGFVFVRNFDLNKYKPYVEEAIKKATGRDLQINGDAKIGISLIPTVVINDVVFANSEWAKEPYMIKLQKLDVKFSIMPLLRKQIEVSKLILQKPEIFLEVSADGKKNWEFGSVGNIKSETSKVTVNNKIKDASAILGIGLVAENVELEDGILSYYDANSDKTTQLFINKVKMDIPGGNETISLDIDAIFEGKDVEAEFDITSLDSILNAGKADFVALLDVLDVKANIKGVIEGIFEEPRYAVEVNVYNPANNFDIPEITLITGIDGDIKSADFVVSNLNVATNEITGKISADWSKQKIRVVADLMSSYFDINTLSKSSVVSLKIPSLINEAQALTFVSNDSVPYDYLNFANASINLNVGKLVFADDFNLTDVVMNADLQNGVLNVKKLDARIGGGKIDAGVVVNSNQRTIAMDLQSSNLKVQDLYPDLSSSRDGSMQILSGGNLDVDLSIKTNGTTYRKLSENVNGQVVAVMDKSELRTGKMDWLTRGVFGQLLSVLGINTNKTSELDLKCAVIRSDIKNGKAEFPSGIVFNAKELKVVGSGNVNLIDDKIDFTVAPMINKLADGNITQALASFVRVGGDIRNPKLYLDKTSALTTIVGSVATGGVYLGSEMLFNSDDDPCYSSLQGTKYSSKFTTSKGLGTTAKNAYQDVSKQTKDVVNGLGKAAKGMFDAFVSGM